MEISNQSQSEEYEGNSPLKVVTQKEVNELFEKNEPGKAEDHVINYGERLVVSGSNNSEPFDAAGIDATCYNELMPSTSYEFSYHSGQDEINASGSAAGTLNNGIESQKDISFIENENGIRDDLLRGCESRDCDTSECASQCMSKKDAAVHKKFEAGDHVIRWKLLKAVLYPIQIHGIVLNVESIDEKKFKVVIADFGYTKSAVKYENQMKEKKGKGINISVARMMQSYCSGDQKEIAESHDNCKMSHNSKLANTGESADKISGMEDVPSVEDEELKQNSNGKRFRVITLTKPSDMKKWSKINYGSALSTKGKLAKMKKWLSSKSLIKKTKKDLGDSCSNNSNFTTELKDHGLERLNDIVSPTSIDNKDTKTVKTEEVPGKKTSSGKTIPKVEEDVYQSNTLAELMTEANEIERQSRSRRRFSPRSKKKTDVSTLQTRKQSGRNIFTKSWFGGSFQRGSINSYSSVALQADSAEPECKGKSCVQTASQSYPDASSSSVQGPKLPKSDPRKIVLARVNYVLAQQDLPESKSTLPPYHVLYSNSECLAVWCKTGSFSTLQAAVFLHSTAVGNAKSTFALTAAVSATQPWLIPFVGIYGIIAIGMPYYLLKRCHNKWKDNETKLTDGFWSTADSEVFVAAIKNWSGLISQNITKQSTNGNGNG